MLNLQLKLWRAKAFEELAEENGAYLFIESSDPELLKGIDTKVDCHLV